MRTASGARSWSEVFRDNSASVWTLTSEGGGEAQLGSAVAVSANTLLTNCHMINNPALVELQNTSGKRVARVVSADTESDRCILLATEAAQDFVSLARPHAAIQVGEEVAAVGSPKGMSNSLSRGIVAGKRTRDGRALIQTDAALSTGSSGGGLFDMAGNLIGITTFRIPDGDRLNFAIAITEFCRR
jgi:S1-C subfamily serine protease